MDLTLNMLICKASAIAARGADLALRTDRQSLSFLADDFQDLSKLVIEVLGRQGMTVAEGAQEAAQTMSKYREEQATARQLEVEEEAARLVQRQDGPIPLTDDMGDGGVCHG